MGFDVNGLDAKSERGTYFRNNIWRWPRLWQLVCEVADDVLTEEDKCSGQFNGGHIISADKAEVIARRLHEACLQQDLYEKQIQDSSQKMKPGIEQVLMKAFSNDSGETEMTPATEGYPFSWDNVKEFAAFCQDSGGFQIC
jgi:hypothetical protein